MCLRHGTLVLHAAFGFHARRGQGEFPRKLPSPRTVFPLLLQLSSRWDSSSHELGPSLAAGGDAQGASGLISHVGPKPGTRLAAHQEGSCTSSPVPLWMLHPWLWLVTVNPRISHLHSVKWDGKKVTAFSALWCLHAMRCFCHESDEAVTSP